jgi:hypothetical protein
MGEAGQRHAPATLPPGKRPGTHCIWAWVGPRASLDWCGKSHPYGDSIPGLSSTGVAELNPGDIGLWSHRKLGASETQFCNVSGCNFKPLLWFLARSNIFVAAISGLFLTHILTPTVEVKAWLPQWLELCFAYVSGNILFACIEMNLWSYHTMLVIASVDTPVQAYWRRYDQLLTVI